MLSIPPVFVEEGWYTLSFVAKRLKRSPRTVHHWAQTGLFTKMGIKVIVIPAKGWAGTAVTWLHIPTSRKYAMLRNISLDIFTVTPLPYESEGAIEQRHPSSL